MRRSLVLQPSSEMSTKKRFRLPGVAAAEDDPDSAVFYTSSSSAAQRPRAPPPSVSAPPASASQLVYIDSITQDGRRIHREQLPIPGLSSLGSSAASLPPVDVTASYDLDHQDFYSDMSGHASSPASFFRDSDAEDRPSPATSELEEHARRYTNSVSVVFSASKKKLMPNAARTSR